MPSGERWTCPGKHCGTYQGYKYGCRAEQCTAAVAPHKSAQRQACGVQPRTPVDDEVRRTVLAAVAAGLSLAAGCHAAGISPFRLGTARRTDPSFDARLVAVAAAAGLVPPVRPVRQLDCPGDDCGTPVGYRYGCRSTRCGEAHSAAQASAPSRQHPTRRRRFGPDDAATVLEELRAGRTIVEACERAGWSYDALSNARKVDPDFDRAVIEARQEGRRSGEPGDQPREVSRLNAWLQESDSLAE